MARYSDLIRQMMNKILTTCGRKIQRNARGLSSEVKKRERENGGELRIAGCLN